ncbi:MAG: hypothetical protein IH845_02775 [Nanoarchaeota archaeon]|nr:hypothetical protein [Nanoarchaeota archaeon]
MKEMLKKGEISILLPEEGGGGLSGEVHLVTYENKKIVIRRCKTLAKAKYYEFLSKKFKKYGFLPKFLGRYGKDVAYEFLEGRDLRGKEKLWVFEEVGRIGGIINNTNINENIDLEFYKTLRELVNGNFSFKEKVAIRRKRSKIKTKPKEVFTKKEALEIKNLYKKIKKKVKPRITLDAVDFTSGNFRISNGKIYLVDIECIKPSIQGQGISKFLKNWGKTRQRKNAFIKGYKKSNNLDLNNQEYKDLIDLRFAVQALWFKIQVARNLEGDLNTLKNLLKKYA